MGEAKQKSRNRKEILRKETRCIYCASKPTTIEHMPPLLLFSQRRRPSGLEFAACSRCNSATKGADAVATFFSRISQDEMNDDDFWLTKEGETLRYTIERDAPNVVSESFNTQNSEHKWLRNKNGLLIPRVKVHVTSSLTKAYLDIFTAKLGLALYREHIGTPLPIDGGIETHWHLNAGLSQERAHAYLSCLPLSNTLKQGKFSVPSQFAYRYNTDQKSILAALIGLNSNLHLFVIASSQPTKFKMPFKFPGYERSGNFFQPGELVDYLERHTTR